MATRLGHVQQEQAELFGTLRNFLELFETGTFRLPQNASPVVQTLDKLYRYCHAFKLARISEASLIASRKAKRPRIKIKIFANFERHGIRYSLSILSGGDWN
jgi:hypothetical protein